MNISGIITEYNPFHNGHLFHLKETKKKSGTVICIMNGNFVQRGRPALLDKWTRTKMAIENGVDLVIELPLVYGIRSAEYFAHGAVELLEATGLVQSIVFGSELGNIKPLTIIAEILNKEKPYFKKRLKYHLNQGLSFPTAREKALIEYLTKNNYNYQLSEQEINQTITRPNNILGIEYIKAIQDLNSKIKPVAIKRILSDYHSKDISGKIASATAIREKFKQLDLKTIKHGPAFQELKKTMPEPGWQILNQALKTGKAPINQDFLGILILARLRTLTPDQLLNYAEIDNGLENRIIEAAHVVGSLTQLIDKIKTKAFTWTRIQRNLLHIFFGLDAREFKLLDQAGVQYLRILGFNQTGEKILSRMMETAQIPVIIQPADFISRIDLKTKDPLIKSLSYDILASDIYSLLFPAPEMRQGHLDFTTPLITY